MENDNVVTGLLRRRQEIVDELEKLQGRVRELIINVDALDVTIRLFWPDAEIGVVRVKPIPRRSRGAARREHPDDHGGAAEVSRAADDPPDRAGSHGATRDEYRRYRDGHTMRLRMASSLLKMKNRGKVRAVDGTGGTRRWGLAGSLDQALRLRVAIVQHVW